MSGVSAGQQRDGLDFYQCVWDGERADLHQRARWPGIAEVAAAHRVDGQQAAAARDQEVGALRAEVSSLLDRFAEAAQPSGRGAWTQRQQQLRDRIRDERKERRRQEFADVEAAHARAEGDRRTRYLIGGATGGLLLIVLGLTMATLPRAVGWGFSAVLIAAGFLAILPIYIQMLRSRPRTIGHLIAAAAGIFTAAIGTFVLTQVINYTYNYSSGWYTYSVPITQGLLVALGALVALACILAGFSVLASRPVRELGRPADSIERLNQAARSYALATRVADNLRRGKVISLNLLRHDDPHFRYAAVITAPPGPDRSSQYDAALADLFQTEPTVVIRRAAARALGTASSDLVRQVLRDGIEAGIPETVYLAETADPSTTLWLADSKPKTTETPAVLLARVREANPDLTRLLTVVAEAADPNVEDSLLDLLGHWYLNERELRSHPIPERFLRRAAALLSPFEKSGLGTFDELTLIPDIDDAYLYYEQLIFYRELEARDE